VKVFLLQDVKAIGRKGEIKDVNDGYARNFLFPKHLAVIPTDKQTKVILEQKDLAKQENKKQLAELSAVIKSLDGKVYVFNAKSDKNGHLYGSLGPKELAEKINIPERMINLHIKTIGKYPLVINFGQDLTATVQIVVEKEK
jgi:large subunit ribosomal protein L9